MKNTNLCENCYVKVKRYTYIRGILSLFFIVVWSIIPLLNLILIIAIWEEAKENPKKAFWEVLFYDIEKIKVVKAK